MAMTPDEIELSKAKLGFKPEKPMSRQPQAEAITKPLKRRQNETKKPQETPHFKFEIPETTFNQVVGMNRQKAIMHKLFELPLRKPIEFEQLGVKRSVGLIMYSAPGLGKTHLAKAIMNDLKVKMCYVKPSEVMQKYVGESSQRIAELFRIAKELNAKKEAACIFFDEADVLLQSRDQISGEGGSNELKQAVSQLLQEVSAVHDDKKSHIYLIGATNAPEQIDLAHRRSGRFEFLLYVKSPNFWDRRKLFKLYIGKESTQFPEKFGNINYSILALATIRYSPSDIEKIVKIAKINSLEQKKVLITTRMVQKALWSKEGGVSSLDSWYINTYHKYLIKRKSLLKTLISKNYREQPTEKTKFDKAEMELYKPMVNDVMSFMRWKWLIRILRLMGRGIPQ